LAQVDVRLVDVTKTYGSDVRAVDGISLDVLDGEFFSLLGPSGCGKTTTLRMIGGFEEPTSGRIELQGEEVTWLPPHRRNVNTVFQNYALFPHLSIRENVAFGLRRRKVADAEVRTRVAEMLELVELSALADRKPGQISGGQAQRVALARALVNRPAVLLLDEPLGALDLRLRKQMQIELKRIQVEVGITFIYVTHDQEEAMTMSDRIAVMNHGRYEQLGAPAEIYERPSTRFVAGFLGASNLLPGTVVGAEGDHVAVRLDLGPIVRLPAAAIAGRSRVDVGVRPEKIRLGSAGAATPGVNAIPGHIQDLSYTGVSTQYRVALADGHLVTAYAQNIARADGGASALPGAEVLVEWDPADAFAVDPLPAGTEPATDPVTGAPIE